MRSRQRFVSGLLGLVLLALCWGGATPAAAVGAPALTVSSAAVWPALPVSVSGRGFAAGPVDVRLDGVLLGRVTAGRSGGFSARLTVPSTTGPGVHRLRAVQGSKSAYAAVRARVQWSQYGAFAAHRSQAFYEHRLSTATVREAKPLYTGDLVDAVPAQAGMVLAQGLLMYGTRNGAMAVDAATGWQVWRYDNGLEDPMNGVAYDPETGTIYFTGQEPYLRALNARTGQSRGVAMELSGRARSLLLTLDQGTLYTVLASRSENGKDLAAIDPVGRKVRWQTPIIDPLSTTSPVLYDGVLYVAGHNLSAFDATSGKLLWRVELSKDPDFSTAQPAVSATGIVFGTSDQTVESRSLTSGQVQWSVAPIKDDSVSVARGITLAEGRVFADYGDRTIALDERAGEVIWQQPGGGVTPVYANGLLIGAINPPPQDHQYFTAVDARTGERLAAYQITNGYATQPIVADGVIYLPDGGGVNAVALPPEPSPG